MGIDIVKDSTMQAQELAKMLLLGNRATSTISPLTFSVLSS
jgi:hypothetical protein